MHPKIQAALIEQAKALVMTSRAYYNNKLGEWYKMMHDTFKYDKALPMNSGSEASETGIKLIRRWAYNVKGIPDGQAKILFANNNFWGRTIAGCAASDDP